MADEEIDAKVADAQENADFGAGFDGKPDKATEKSTTEKLVPERPTPAATPRAEEKPEYVQITAKDLSEFRAAAAKTASYDQQLSRAFGTIGNLQKILNEQKAAGQPAAAAATARKFEVPKEAFASMSRDFPELAEQTRAALEAALAGVNGTGANDADTATTFKSLLAAEKSKQQIEDLEDAYPTWREIVGAVDVTREQPNAENPFRKWLSGKPADYQARINGSESAAVIGRAIRLFQNETKAAPPKVNGTPRDTARADRIRGAVQPRGDSQGAPAGRSDDDEFLAGFNSR